jgi:AcrR family transcriptional regulator
VEELTVETNGRRVRSTLPKPAARQRYIEIGELVVLEQIRNDAERLDTERIAVGPFASLDANLVAALDGKTRGAITNLFGSQAAFQAETMALALEAGDWIERLEYPAPSDFPTVETWLDALLGGESARGPVHGSEPRVDYGFLWALWLSAIPYGLWSEQIRQPSMEEHVLWLGRLSEVIEAAIRHFDVDLRDGTTVDDLAVAFAGLIEGSWLNQCLTTRHPTDPSEPIATVMRRSGHMLWRGATRPRTDPLPT